MIRIGGRQRKAVASAIYHALAEYFDVQYDGPGEPLSEEEADERIYNFHHGRRVKAKVVVNKR